MTNRLRTLVCALLVTAASPAAAQVWLEDRGATAGPGFKLGDSVVLHPSLAVEGGYDTNVLYRPPGEEVGAASLRITPSLDLQPPGGDGQGGEASAERMLDYRLGLAGSYTWYFSDDKQVAEQGGAGISAAGALTILPAGAFSLLLDAAYTRSLQSYETAADAHARDTVRPGIGLRYRPGNGTLTFQLSYHFELTLFEDSMLAERNDRQVHQIDYENRWKVFPKTAVFSRVSFAPSVYTGAQDFNNDSLPVRTVFGLQGLLTDRFGLLASAGYGASFYEAGPDFDSYLLKGELMFYFTPTATLRAGGERDFVDSFYANYYVKNGGYLTYQQKFFGVLLATLRGECFYRDYATFRTQIDAATTASTDERSDVVAAASLSLEYMMLEWLSLMASGRYTTDITDFNYTVVDDETGATTEINGGYSKIEAYGGLRAHY